MEVIREELEGVKRDFGDARRTEILESRLDLTLADLITEEERVVTISHGGYAKSQPLAAYQAQRRGGRGKAATGVKEEDYVEHLLVANSHATLLLFSSKGKVYWLKTYEIPEASRTSRGRPLVNLLPLDEGERITAMLQVDLEALRQQASDEDDLDDAVEQDEVEDLAEGEDAAEEVVEWRLHLYGNRQRYREEDAAGSVQSSPQQWSDCPAPRGRRYPDRRCDYRRQPRGYAVLRRRQGDSLQGRARAHHGAYRTRCARHAPAGRPAIDLHDHPEPGAQILSASLHATASARRSTSIRSAVAAAKA